MTLYTNEELTEMLKVADSKIKSFEEKERINYIKIIKKFGDKYSDQELEKKDLKDLEVIVDACSRFHDISEDKSKDKPETIPIGHKTPKEDLKVEGRIDFANAFADVSEDFDMGGVKVKK